jgi:hypothetical protein
VHFIHTKIVDPGYKYILSITIFVLLINRLRLFSDYPYCMKSAILSLIFFCFVYPAISQQKMLHIPIDGNDTCYYYKLIMQDCASLSITPLQQSNYPYHFRLWSPEQMIEVWKTSEGYVKGNVLNWAYSSNDKKNTPPFEESVPLNKSEAPDIYELIQKMQIADIPDQKSIKNWSDGLDAPDYMIEYEEGNDYYFKSYWYPAGFSQLKEAVTIDKFITETFKLANVNSKEEGFLQVMPRKYSRSHYGVSGVKITTAPHHEEPVQLQDIL